MYPVVFPIVSSGGGWDLSNPVTIILIALLGACILTILVGIIIMLWITFR